MFPRSTSARFRVNFILGVSRRGRGNVVLWSGKVGGMFIVIDLVCRARPRLHRREHDPDWRLAGEEARGELVRHVGGPQPGQVVQPGGNLTAAFSLTISHYHRLRSDQNRNLMTESD